MYNEFLPVFDPKITSCGDYDHKIEIKTIKKKGET